MAKTPLSAMADYAQGLLSSQKSQKLQESFINFLKSIGSDAPARPGGEVIGAQPPQPGTIDQLFPRRPPSPPSQLPPPEIAAPNPGGGMVPQSVLTDIQNRLPEVPPAQGVWDGALKAVEIRSAEQAQRVAEEAQRVLLGEQQIANIGRTSAAESEAARAAKDAPGYVDGLLSRFGLGRKPASPSVQVAPPEGYDEALEAAKVRQRQLVSGQTDNLRGQDKGLNDFKRSLIDEQNEKAALEYAKKADAMERQQRISDQMKSGVEGLRTAGVMGGALGAAVTVPAIVAGMTNAPSPMAPKRKEPETTADLASEMPSIEATPDEQPPQAPAQQPSYMSQNPGTPAPPPPKPQAELLDEGLRSFGADTRPEITPEQREKAKQDFRASQDLENHTNRWAGSSAINEAVDRVLGPIKGKSQDEDRRLAAMASDQDLAHMEEMQRQEASNGRMAAMAQSVSKPQASMDVLPSDNLAAVEQELTPEPMVKGKPAPIATASAYDDPTGTRFNQLIQRLATKNGMTPEQARAIYQENSAKGLSPRQAMQPLIDMGQAAFMNGEATRKGNVARAAMLDPRNPRRESNAFGMMSPDDQQFAAASRFTKNPGIAPRDVAHQRWSEEVRAKEALAARENALEMARVTAQGPVNQAMWTAGGQVLGAGLGALGNYFQNQATMQAAERAATQEQAAKQKIAETQSQGMVDAADKHNEPRPPTVEDKAKAEQVGVQTEGMKKSLERMTEAEKHKQGDAMHRVEGGTAAILNGAFRTKPAVDALKELAKQAINANSTWNSAPGNKAEAFDQSLKQLGLENEMLRKQLTQEYIGRATTNPAGASAGFL